MVFYCCCCCCLFFFFKQAQPIKLIYAYGLTDDITYHQARRGTKEVNLLDYMPRTTLTNSKYFSVTVDNVGIIQHSYGDDYTVFFLSSSHTVWIDGIYIFKYPKKSDTYCHLKKDKNMSYIFFNLSFLISFHRLLSLPITRTTIARSCSYQP